LGRRLSKRKEGQLYNAVPKLWPIGEVALEELYFLKEIDCGMLQPKDKIDYPVYFYEHQLKKALTLDEVANITIKDKKDCWFDSDNSRTIS
jgi:hypothetical protein